MQAGHGSKYLFNTRLSPLNSYLNFPLRIKPQSKLAVQTFSSLNSIILSSRISMLPEPPAGIRSVLPADVKLCCLKVILAGPVLLIVSIGEI